MSRLRREWAARQHRALPVAPAGRWRLDRYGGWVVALARRTVYPLRDAEGVLNNMVFTLHEDPDGTLWIGTGGG
ncbi:hypothetical protein J8C07_12975 [Chloracidobacterium sp. S]|nr:hypothetical protein J8C07_12975 [Chloracidobacterium sp. S]